MEDEEQNWLSLIPLKTLKMLTMITQCSAEMVNLFKNAVCGMLFILMQQLYK